MDALFDWVRKELSWARLRRQQAVVALLIGLAFDVAGLVVGVVSSTRSAVILIFGAFAFLWIAQALGRASRRRAEAVTEVAQAEAQRRAQQRAVMMVRLGSGYIH